VEHYTSDSMLLLKDGAHSLGVPLEAIKLDQFSIYLRELKKWNRVFNLTSIKEDFTIVTKHFLDSLSAAPFLSDARTLLDLGSGAGFPGIPLKIYLQHLHIVLADAKLKKVRFLQHIVRSLGLEHIDVIHRHINWRSPVNQEQLLFDTIISRGTLSLTDLLETGKIFLKPGGTVIWMFGSNKKATALIQSVRNDISDYFEIRSINTFVLPFLKHKRTITTFYLKP